jgi:hypothetical protein
MTIKGELSAAREEASLEDNDVEDDTYVPSPRAPIRGRGKGLASASGSRVARDDKIEEEEEDDDGNDGDDGEEGEKTFDVEDINPTSYIHMGTPIFRQPLNPNWREKISYKSKIDLVREKKERKPKAY